MSYILKKAKIINFRGNRDVKIDFDRNSNFLIGINGSGKTTIINILKDAITFENSLRVMPADGVEIHFRYTGSKAELPSNPSVLIKKKKSLRRVSQVQILYQVSEGAGYEEVYSDEEVIGNRSARYLHGFPSLKRALKSLPIAKNINVSWFSIQRKLIKNLEPWEADDEEEGNPLDERINVIANATSSYFFEMDARHRKLMSQFQKDYFRIMTKYYGQEDLDNMKVDLENFSDVMSLILDSLDINTPEMADNIDKLVRILESKNVGDFEELENAVDRAIAQSTVKKMTEIIEKWNSTQLKIEKNFEPKSQFVDVMNAFFNGKTMFFRANNSPAFRIRNDSHDSTVLSSGEKQLLIFMMEALNQRKRTHIFIADEPELSLHVDWQEMLVENIRKVNPAAQVIFATHSPDIVGSNDGNVLDLAKFIG